MSAHENPFDHTVWDPFNPEQAIEDPMHGPSAVADLLAAPPMPLGDSQGTYCQPGGFYAVGTLYFNSKGQPVYRVGSARGTPIVMQEIHDLAEWREASCLGEDALTSLEARRQQDRLDRTGVAYAFKPSDVCGGGKRLDECETAAAMMQAAEASAGNVERREMPGEGKVWNTLAWLGRSCTTCSLQCAVAYETHDGEPTGTARFSNTRPWELDFPVVRIDFSEE